MAGPTGFIQRTASLLWPRGAGRRRALLPQPSDARAGVSLPGTKTLDLRALAGLGIPMPAMERSRVVEEFRLIKRNLIRAWSPGEAAGDRPASRSIMVTSARPGEGKTFIALNLALAFAAEADGEAWLVDADLTHPLLGSFFGDRAEAGLVDVLAGRLALSDVVLGTSVPKLSVLPAGRGGPEVPELLASKRMSALLAEMTECHRERTIIIDTPSCLVSSDAATLASMVGQIVFVVEAHRTQQHEIETGLGLVGSCQRISLLLNKCDRTTSEHFGSHGYHYSGRKSDAPPAAEQS
jgi:protein-tyrosine kinase